MRKIKTGLSYRLPPKLKLPQVRPMFYYTHDYTTTYCVFGHRYSSPERGFMWVSCPECAFMEYDIEKAKYQEWLRCQHVRVQKPARKITVETAR